MIHRHKNMPKPNRFKKKPKLATGDIKPEEWSRLNRAYFGEDNVDWDIKNEVEEDSDETEEISFGEG